MIITLVALPFALSAAVAGISAAPWVPTKRHERQFLIDHLTIDSTTTVIDLGCGTGSFLFDVAERQSNATLIGYDISLLPLFFGHLRRFFHRKKFRNVDLRFGNLFAQNLEHADVIFAFLLPKCYPKLIKTLAASVRPTAVIVIEAWPLDGHTPIHVIEHPGHVPMYLYRGKDLHAV